MCLPVNEVIEILNQFKCVIVHCAGYAKGSGFSIEECGYLERLKKVIEQRPPVPCSTIFENDTFFNNNYTGHIGVILSPNSDNAISHATPYDAGTCIAERNEAARNKQSITKTQLINAIKNRKNDAYNELCLYNYDVRGVFFDQIPVSFTPDIVGLDICATSVKNNGIIPNKEYGAADIYREFNGNAFYYLRNGHFYNVTFENGEFNKGKYIDMIDLL